MEPVGANRARKAGVAGDNEQNTPPPADFGVAAGDTRAPRVVIIAINDGRAGGERAQDRFGALEASPVGEESERKRRIGDPARAFERARRGC